PRFRARTSGRDQSRARQEKCISSGANETGPDASETGYSRRASRRDGGVPKSCVWTLGSGALKRPATIYRPSPRLYPESLPPIEYPGHLETRKIDSRGHDAGEARADLHEQDPGERTRRS